MSETPERRQHERAPLAFPIRLRIGDINQFTEEHSSDLSAGGIFVKMNYPPPVGTKVELEFHLDSVQKTIKAQGEVRRSIPEGGDSTPGMGIEFIELGQDGRRFIELVVKKYNRLHPSGVLDLPDGFLDQIGLESALPGSRHPAGTELELRLTLPDGERFLNDHGHSLMRDRMFIRTRSARAVGTRVHIHVLLEKENRWISAEGEVVANGEKGGAELTSGPGMTLRIRKKSPEFLQLLQESKPPA